MTLLHQLAIAMSLAFTHAIAAMPAGTSHKNRTQPKVLLPKDAPTLAELQAGGVDPDIFPELPSSTTSAIASVRHGNWTESGGSTNSWYPWVITQRGYDWKDFDGWYIPNVSSPQNCGREADYLDSEFFTWNENTRVCYVKYPLYSDVGGKLVVSESEYARPNADFPGRFDTVSFTGYPEKICQYYCTLDGYPDKGFPPCMAYVYSSNGCYLKHPDPSADWAYAGAVGATWGMDWKK
ncbi:hypothetical protein BDR26DRAFT_934351 [Obelidium mucronatum]|nr:hypothetical protein BDR26DRAFT_934351 [Obelidium mucronatum]